MIVKRSGMVILVMGMFSSRVFSSPYLEGTPIFRQPMVNFTSNSKFEDEKPKICCHPSFDCAFLRKMSRPERRAKRTLRSP